MAVIRSLLTILSVFVIFFCSGASARARARANPDNTESSSLHIPRGERLHCFEMLLCGVKAGSYENQARLIGKYYKAYPIPEFASNNPKPSFNSEDDSEESSDEPSRSVEETVKFKTMSKKKASQDRVFDTGVPIVERPIVDPLRLGRDLSNTNKRGGTCSDIKCRFTFKQIFVSLQDTSDLADYSEVEPSPLALAVTFTTQRPALTINEDEDEVDNDELVFHSDDVLIPEPVQKQKPIIRKTSSNKRRIVKYKSNKVKGGGKPSTSTTTEKPAPKRRKAPGPTRPKPKTKNKYQFEQDDEDYDESRDTYDEEDEIEIQAGGGGEAAAFDDDDDELDDHSNAKQKKKKQKKKKKKVKGQKKKKGQASQPEEPDWSRGQAAASMKFQLQPRPGFSQASYVQPYLAAIGGRPLVPEPEGPSGSSIGTSGTGWGKLFRRGELFGKDDKEKDKDKVEEKEDKDKEPVQVEPKRDRDNGGPPRRSEPPISTGGFSFTQLSAPFTNLVKLVQAGGRL